MRWITKHMSCEKGSQGAESTAQWEEPQAGWVCRQKRSQRGESSRRDWQPRREEKGWRVKWEVVGSGFTQSRVSLTVNTLFSEEVTLALVTPV